MGTLLLAWRSIYPPVESPPPFTARAQDWDLGVLGISSSLASEACCFQGPSSALEHALPLPGRVHLGHSPGKLYLLAGTSWALTKIKKGGRERDRGREGGSQPFQERTDYFSWKSMMRFQPHCMNIGQKAVSWIHWEMGKQ